ncbi:MAG: Fur family transcriptional regulator [Candidatus Aquicultor sp.]
MSYYNDLIKDLKDRGFRLTKLRKAILEELDLARKPLSAAEIIEQLKKHDLKPHKTSIYREVTFMLEQGIITKITFGERQDRFELAAIEHHHHAMCQSCGEIEDIDCSEGIREIEKMLHAQDFKVNFHLVEFIGLCKNCR